MIPQILEIKNFLSYGEPTQRIDFKNYSLICLSGKNGHGKSALLDAITWCVWGQARKISGAAKADEGLLRLGQTRMMVSLEFLFNGRTYRVRRELANTYSKPYAALDFEVYDSSSEKYLSLTDKTIRATQAKIENLIGLDYETFVNSAFIRQGQSNEFSKKSAKERKQILATILGLSKYDLLQQEALEHAKKLNEQKRILNSSQEQLCKDLTTEPEVISKITNQKNELAIITQQLTSLQADLTAQENLLASCHVTKKAYEKLKQDISVQEEHYKQGIASLIKNVHEWKKSHKLTLTQTDLVTITHRRDELEARIKKMLANQQKGLSLQEELFRQKEMYQKMYSAVKVKYDKIINDLKIDVKQAELNLENITKQKASKNLDHQKLILTLNSVQTDLEKLEKQCVLHAAFDIDYATTKQQFEKRKAFYQSMVQQGNWLKSELGTIEHKLSTINQPNNPSCPLCEQLLTAKRKQYLATQLVQEERKDTHQLTRISNLIKKLKEILVTQHETLQQYAQTAAKNAHDAAQLNSQRERVKELTQHVSHIQAEQAELSIKEKELIVHLISTQKKLQEELAGYEINISSDTGLMNLEAQIKTLEDERSNLNVHSTLLQKTQEELKNIQDSINQLGNIQQTLNLQQERKQLIHTQCMTLKNQKSMILQAQKTCIIYEASLKDEQIIIQRRDTINKSLLENNHIREQKLQLLGSLEYECSRLSQLKEIHALNTTKIKALDDEIEDYQTIAVALSKNGIQALLIEEAIPEIESEANRLLARLTDNQAQIFIESLRDLKNGGVRETLDIQISDASGIRPYEMYSGGEAFRVDFSLRIAIAKLLARRAGTALQTLIIDEGFGSQDEDGLAHIMDCLYAIQDDFAKIIIVSHLSEFKHNFPVHFIIEKSPTGSVVHVEERG